MKKRSPYAIVSAPFATLAPRKISFLSDDACNMPGPDEYSLDKERETTAVGSAAFKSNTDRFAYRKVCEVRSIFFMSNLWDS